jgi:S1-C subfamily serine protease
LKLKDGHDVREGETLYFTGFPIGTVLGLFPATHHGMVSALTPIAIAPATASELDPKLVRRLSKGSFQVFQLDGTAYPGNSGSPLYEGDSGDVVGIINMVFVKGTKEAALTAPSGITYAIPATYLQELVRRVR